MEPCVVLEPRQESHETTMAPEFSVPKPDLLSYLDCEEEATAVDLHVSRDPPAAEHGAGAGQEEPAEEKPSMDNDHAQPPASPGEAPAANTCSDCGRIFSHRPSLAKHRKTHSSGEGSVQRCVPAGERPHGSSLARHQQRHLGEKPFECGECGKAFAWSSHLQRHRRVHTGEKPFECGECGRAFAWSFHRDRHMRTHVAARVAARVTARVTARVATRVTARVTAADEEGVQAAPEPPPAPRKCADCGKSLSPRTARRRFKHKATQTPLAGTGPAPRPRRCEQCGKRSSSSSGLLQHQRVHGSERPRRCPRCPRRFRCGTALAEHRRSHPQPPGDARPAAEGAAKRFPCGACGKSFGRLPHLQRHRRLHRGEEPFQRGLCGKGCSWSSRCDQHQLTRAGEKPFACGKRFGRSSHRSPPERRRVCPDCGTASGLDAALGPHQRLPGAGARSPPALLLRPEEPSSAETDSLQRNATAPTEPWLSLPPPSS